MISGEVGTAAVKSKYPYIGRCKDNALGELIVLFVTEGRGTVLFKPNDNSAVGEYSKDWYEDQFEPLVGYIKLSND